MRAHQVARLLAVERILDPRHAWEHTHGLSVLLEVAKRLPKREDPWDFSGVDPSELTGMAKLLYEARQWQQEHGRGKA